MIIIKPLSSFERSVKKPGVLEKALVSDSLLKLYDFLQTGETSSGPHFKKINHDKYEFRVDIRLRVVVKKEGNIYYLVLAGGHDKIRQYLRRYR